MLLLWRLGCDDLIPVLWLMLFIVGFLFFFFLFLKVRDCIMSEQELLKGWIEN